MISASSDFLGNFLAAAQGRSQEEIIIAFLDVTINIVRVSESGSILINHPRPKKLVLFNEGDFLFKKRILDVDARTAWPKEFGHFEGVAGRSFQQRRTLVFSKAKARGEDAFIGQSPIQNMICVPILTGNKDPFGVVCFHNNDSQGEFTDDDIEILESYVNVLAVALHVPHPELQLEKNVFIVHGRDSDSLSKLKLLLHEYGMSPKVLQDTDKNAQSILEALEDLLRTCKAGFVLMTPDDEGRLANSKEQFHPRARENVIFETGLLFAKFREFRRVALLLKLPVELPSDLSGISYDRFEDIGDIQLQIVEKLRNWGLRPERRS